MMTEREAHEKVPCPACGGGPRVKQCGHCEGEGFVERWVEQALKTGEVE